MNEFEIEAWHILTAFGTALLAIFKQEVHHIVSGMAILWRRQLPPGRSVQIQSVSGAWEEVVIISYHAEIPFTKRGGGVLVRHPNGGDQAYREKIPLGHWKQVRARVPEDGG